MSYSAVATTGIYCRPGCPARPNPENVRTYELAAAAEAAGYRACLRCRPYRSDQPVDVIGPGLVCRAVRLIVDGALDHGNETELGARLGVSARHLRRTFVEHVGVTPDQLARSRRTHFARRLLDDTDLSVTDIAFAAGFGSVRQLNRACTEVFRSTPSELRARRRSSDRLAADGGLTLRLGFRPPLDWDAMLGYLADRAIPGVEHVSGGVYRRTILVGENPGVIEIMPGGEDHLLLRAHLPHWEGLIHVVQQARRIFNLDSDPEAANAHLEDDPTLGPLVRTRPGLRMPGTWDPYEIGVRAIVGQQVSVASASTVAGRIVERHGVPVPGLEQMGLTHLFPTAATLAVADLDDLGLTSGRIAAVRAFAEAARDEVVPLDGSVGLTELQAALVDLPGIGSWTAQYLALRLGEPDAFPATDLGLRRAVEGAPVNGARSPLVERAERWRPWRAQAAIHLWLSDHLAPVA